MNYKAEFFICLFLGAFGGHRFYRKQFGMGVLYLCTVGLFFVGWIYDLVKLIGPAFTYDEEKLQEFSDNRIADEERTAEVKRQKAELRQAKLAEAKAEMQTNADMIEQRKEAAKITGQACCPKCGSTSLVANKKGFGVGKAVVGAWAVGPIGLVGGNIGANKVKVTCLNCGYQFKPGKH